MDKEYVKGLIIKNVSLREQEIIDMINEFIKEYSKVVNEDERIYGLLALNRLKKRMIRER